MKEQGIADKTYLQEGSSWKDLHSKSAFVGIIDSICAAEEANQLEDATAPP